MKEKRNVIAIDADSLTYNWDRRQIRSNSSEYYFVCYQENKEKLPSAFPPNSGTHCNLFNIDFNSCCHKSSIPHVDFQNALERLEMVTDCQCSAYLPDRYSDVSMCRSHNCDRKDHKSESSGIETSWLTLWQYPHSRLIFPSHQRIHNPFLFTDFLTFAIPPQLSVLRTFQILQFHSLI
jgi:hypothetical protein